jgi:hypothetical protein
MMLKNATIKWVYHNQANRFGKHNLTVELNDEQAAELEAAGLSLKEDEDGKRYDFTQHPVKKDGSKNPMAVFNRFGEPFEGIVPNGTKADIQFVAREWAVSGNTGVKGYIRGVKLLGDVMDNSLEFDSPEPADDDPL